jgi:hypothetical protein
VSINALKNDLIDSLFQSKYTVHKLITL